MKPWMCLVLAGLLPAVCAGQVGTITTVAGASTVGDGGAASAAWLRLPQGVAVGPSGEVYVADYFNHRVRRFTLGGAITTVAGTGIPGLTGDGGPATSASIEYPRAVAVDSQGNLYVAHSLTVRKVTPAGVITRFAGTGTYGFAGDGGQAVNAQFGSISGLGFDTAGNLYVADSGNNRIRRITPAGIVQTVAGNGQSGSAGDGGSATSAALAYPSAVAVDGSGNIYIADTNNSRIRRVTPAGVISTFAGTGACGDSGDGGPATAAALCYPAGLALDAAGNLYVADTSNTRVRKITPGGLISAAAGNRIFAYAGDGGAATSASLYQPVGLAVSRSGELYIADTVNGRIRRVDQFNQMSTAAGSGNTASSPVGDGGRATSAYLFAPEAVAPDKSGGFYIADASNRRIRYVSAGGTINTIAGNGYCCFSADNQPASGAYLSYPQFVTLDAAGNVYFGDNNRVRKISTGGILTTVAGNGNYGSTGDGGAATGAQLNSPAGVAFDAQGNMYIADYWNHKVRKVTPSGVISTVAGTGVQSSTGDGGAAAAATLNAPSSVAVDAAGNLYIAEQSYRVRRVTPGGVIDTYAGTGQCCSGGDGGAARSARIVAEHVAVDPSGNLFVAGNGLVKMVTPAGLITTVAGTGLSGNAGDNGPATSALLSSPEGIATDASGNLYIADYGNHKVRKVSFGAAAVNGFTVAGGFLRSPTPNAIAPGGFVTITGRGLATSIAGCVEAPGTAWIGETLVGAQALPTDLSGIRVTFGSTPAPIVRVCRTPQEAVTVLAPFELGAGQVIVTLRTPDGATTTIPNVLVAPAIPELGWTYGLPRVAHALRPDGSSVTTANPARRGESIRLYATGLGAATPALRTNVTGQNETVYAQVTAVLNGVNVQPSAVRYMQGRIGIYELQVTIPNDMAIGAEIPLVLLAQIPGSSAVASAGTVLPVAAAATSCSFTLSKTSASYASAGGTDTVNVTAPAGCAWSASSGASWMTITAGASGNGNGTVSFTVQANTASTQRIGTLTIAAQTFTGTQAGVVATRLPSATISGLSATHGAAEQPRVRVSIPQALSAEVQGVLTLTFTSTAPNAADDPAVAFASGSRQASFRIPAGSTTAVFGTASDVALSTGTVAGNLGLSASFTDASGQDVTPATRPVLSAAVQQGVPVLTGVRITRTGTRLDVEVQGYTTSRELRQAVFTYSGNSIQTPSFTVSISADADTWFRSSGSARYGGTFRYTQSFTVTQGSITDVTGVAVTLTNVAGTSQSRTGN